MTEESVVSNIADGQIIGIQFGLATHNEIRKSSISDCPISHASQLANPFLGLPLEIGKCESCGTAELGKCEGHFGYIELPIPVYHPSHISELKRLLGMLCLKCLKLKTSKPVKSSGVMERLLTSCCEETCHISIRESTTNDGASFLELRLPARYKILEGSWNFLEKYGYRYGDGTSRTLLASEVLMILRKLRDETRKKLARKGYFPQDGYVLKYLPVPPNCLSVPDVSDGVSVMSSDLSTTMLKKVLRQIEIIRSSRSGEPNFESHEVEANELQIAISQYLQVRGTGKAARDADNRYGVTKEGNNSSTKAWLEKMRTLFISKGSGFSSRSVITGDAYKPVNEVGLPSEIAQKMTFEERVNVHNIQYLQGLVDKNLCLTFRDGLSTYSLREGSKGHTFLKLGQVVHRRIMDGDIVFINRPPTTHKHSLQALRVYIHDGHTVKINPLMCGPLAADFDGDCVHLFYPQSLSARAEVVELFSVEKQLLSSHSGNLNLQLATDSLLSLKTMFQSYFLDKASIQQLAMYASTPLPSPALLKSSSFGPRWTALQVLQTALPSQFECRGERLLIRASEVVKLDFSWDAMASVINEILTSLFFNKSPMEALNFFDSLQPLLMENLFSEGFSVGLHDFYVPISELQSLQSQIQDISPLLLQLRSSFNELVQLQFDSFMQHLKIPVANFILNSSALGKLIDGRSDSAVNKVVQQIGFLGLQLSDKRKFYSKSLVEEVAFFFHRMYPFVDLYPSEEFGLVKSCFFRGLDPYEEIVHSIATREVIVRSSKGLAEPGTLFKNLMAILRDVVICYDGSVRNISSNSIIQFEYGVGGSTSQSLFPAGEPVGVLAATAMSNPAYKAVLDSSPNSNSSWDMMKEILFCRVNFKNDLNDRRVILYLNDCECGRKHCQERASYLVKNHLQKVSLRDAAVEFLIEYKHSKAEPESAELLDTGLVGHIHLNKGLVDEANVSMHEILQKCEDEVNSLRRKKKYGYHFKRIALSVSDCCFFQHSGSKWSNVPCLKFIWQDMTDVHLEKTSHIMADLVCPILLDTVIKGDPRISTANIVWISPDTTSWVQSPCSSTKGELAVEVTLEKTAVRQNGDAWRIVLDCCHPVFHLIDTTRSIPYAIKQIQDLFGISCAFDQVVQRLSTSVSMVTKGVLKDHLILLASSMTCAGNLVGFNMSGIKALCRALNVQVPFTEATLYTPRKCFERASEKCHVDSLASIVASCSWGKNVAVGTGAKFDLLWDTKESGMENNPVDIYNFLQMVRGSTEEENDAGCLGEDIDEFDWEDAFMEPAMSPDQENKAVFEENIEVGLDSQASKEGDSNWDLTGGKGWNANGNNNSGSVSGTAENGGWSSWGLKKDHSQLEEPSKSGGWDTFKSHNESNPTEPSSAWGKPVKETENAGWQNNECQQDLKNAVGSSGWDNIVSKETNKLSSLDRWGQPETRQQEPTNAWKKDVGVKNAEGSSGWDNIVANEPNKLSSSGRWGQPEIRQQEPTSTWKKDVGVTNSEGSSGWDNIVAKEPNKLSSSDRWGQPQTRQQEPTNSWKKDVEKKKADSTEKDVNPQLGWGSDDGKRSQMTWDSSLKEKPNQATGTHGWDSASTDNVVSSKWGQATDSSRKENRLESSDGWNSVKLNEQPGSGSWGSDKKEGNRQLSGAHPSWKNSNERAGGWKAERAGGEAGSGSWASKVEEGKTSSSWGQPSKSTQSPGGWSSGKANEEAGVKSWESKKQESKTQSSWGQSSVSTQSPGGWKAEKASEEAGVKSWESKKQESKTQSSWGQPSISTQSPGGWKAEKASEEAGVKSWESKKQESITQSSWGQPSISAQSPGGWKAEKAREEAGSGSWASKVEEGKTPSSWGPPSKSTESAGGWKAEKAGEKEGSGSWDSKVEEGKTQSSWGQPSKSTESVGAWTSGEAKEEAGGKRWESKNEESKTESSWGKPSDSSWKNSTQSAAGGWSSEKGNEEDNASSESESQSQWGQPAWKKKRPEGGRGWGASNSGEWKNKRNRPPKQEGRNDDSNIVAFTATRKRMDIFTPEEQDAVSEIEAIMQSIRRIMHQSGFNDGDPLPADDQSYIINNVLNHHPDKEAKMGAGVDYITVKKHSNFQESRCFYVVSTDGQTQDFSYIKCLGSLIKGKYPSVAESFTSKYFGRSRGVGNRQQDGGSRQQDGGNRQQDGGNRQQDWGNRQQDGGNRQQGWGNHQQEGESQQQVGWNRQQDGGNRQQEGGSQQQDGGNHQQDGGNRKQDWGNRQPDGENHQQE